MEIAARELPRHQGVDERKAVDDLVLSFHKDLDRHSTVITHKISDSIRLFHCTLPLNTQLLRSHGMRQTHRHRVHRTWTTSRSSQDLGWVNRTRRTYAGWCLRARELLAYPLLLINTRSILTPWKVKHQSMS